MSLRSVLLLTVVAATLIFAQSGLALAASPDAVPAEVTAESGPSGVLALDLAWLGPDSSYSIAAVYRPMAHVEAVLSVGMQSESASFSAPGMGVSVASCTWSPENGRS